MSGDTGRILVVDDDDGARYAKARLLLRHGYTVREASRGQEALIAVFADAPDLVLLDVNLPDMNGIEVCRELKARLPHVIVLQTSAAFTGVYDRTRALAGGADSYLVEPIEPEELIATIHALLRMCKAEQELRRVNDNLERLVNDRTRELVEANHRLATEIAERRKAEAALWHTQKLDIIGRLTGGFAHDFNNLLMVISGNLELTRDALRDTDLAPSVSKLLATAASAAAQGGKIARQLLAFARRSQLAVEIIALREFMSARESLLRRAAGDAVTLSITSPPALWNCKVDPSQLEAAILNLVVNARDAMPDGGMLRIAMDNFVVDEPPGATPNGVVPGAYVRIKVCDSGVGMSPDIIEQAFEPFFTTKDVGKGTGLGLSQVYGFVTQSEGQVVIDSAPGHGTIVSLYLPRIDASSHPIAAANARSPEEAANRNQTVLVVDDNKEVREVTTLMLDSLGYHVLDAGSATEALTIINSSHVDLLVSDVVMPGIDGFELARRARALRPGLPILVMSGYTAMPSEAPRSSEFPILRKPFLRAEVAGKIRDALKIG